LFELPAAHDGDTHAAAAEQGADLLREANRRQVVAGPVAEVAGEAHPGGGALGVTDQCGEPGRALAPGRHDVDAVDHRTVAAARAEAVEGVVGEGELEEGHGSGLRRLDIARRRVDRHGDRPVALPAGLFEQPSQSLAQRRQRHLARLAEADGDDAAKRRLRAGGGQHLAVAAGEGDPFELAREVTAQRGRQSQSVEHRPTLVGEQVQAVERPRGGTAPHRQSRHDHPR
jgi:hypothetical protein